MSKALSAAGRTAARNIRSSSATPDGYSRGRRLVEELELPIVDDTVGDAIFTPEPRPAGQSAPGEEPGAAFFPAAGPGEFQQGVPLAFPVRAPAGIFFISAGFIPARMGYYLRNLSRGRRGGEGTQPFKRQPAGPENPVGRPYFPQSQFLFFTGQKRGQ